MDLYLIRHTRLAIAPDVCYGQSEIELADTFDDELATIRARLPPGFDFIYSSPSRRCTQLAECLGKSLETDARLLEYHFGDWEFERWDAIDRDALDAWTKDFVHRRPPNGDNLVELSARVGEFVDALRRQRHQRVLVVTHAGVIRCIVSRLLQIPLQQIFKLQVGYGMPLRVRLGAKAELDQVFTDSDGDGS